MTNKDDSEIADRFNHNKLKKLCDEKGCDMPEDALTQIANTPMCVRMHYEKIGEIRERKKIEKDVNEMTLCFKNGMSEFCPKRDCTNSICPLNITKG